MYMVPVLCMFQSVGIVCRWLAHWEPASLSSLVAQTSLFIYFISWIKIVHFIFCIMRALCVYCHIFYVVYFFLDGRIQLGGEIKTLEHEIISQTDQKYKKYAIMTPVELFRN